MRKPSSVVVFIAIAWCCRESTTPLAWAGGRPDQEEVTIGFGSCLMQAKLGVHEGQGYRPYKVLEQVVSHELDMFVFMGDAVYGDFPGFYSSGCCSRPPNPTCRAKCFEDGTIGTRLQLDAKYNMLFEDTYFADLIKRVKTVFMWDDHELFDNYKGGSGHVYFPTARAAFEHHLARVHNPAPWRSGELYFNHLLPSGLSEPLVDLFVLDGRSHRSNSEMLGAEQFQDLEAWLLGPTRARWRVIVSSTMFAEVASGVGSDNWSNYRVEKRKLFDAIYASDVGGVLLVSGDAHFAAIVEHRNGWAQRRGQTCRIVEVCASPLAAVPLKPQSDPNTYTGKQFGFDEEVKFLRSGDHLYATVAFDQSKAVVRVWSYSEGTVSPKSLIVEARLQWSPVCVGELQEM